MEKETAPDKITTDLSAPEFYSQNIIYSFSFLFGTLFGSILMAMNCSRTKSKKGIIEAIIFGVVYTAITIYVVNLQTQSRSSSMTILFNIGGALILKHLFWNKYLGEETKYRKRPYWTPLAIGITMLAILIYLAISTMN